MSNKKLIIESCKELSIITCAATDGRNLLNLIDCAKWEIIELQKTIEYLKYITGYRKTIGWEKNLPRKGRDFILFVDKLMKNNRKSINELDNINYDQGLH